MRQLTYIEKDRLEWREAPEPRIEAEGEALVRPVAVATCDLDLWMVRGRVPYQGPLPAGHEGVGEVTDVGAAVSTVEPGQLVSIPFQVSCGECATCARGQTGNCERVGRMATYGLPIGENHGGFLSDSVKVPFADGMLLAVPDGIEPASIASLSDNIPDAWRSVGPQLEAQPGAEVLVCGGAGSIALYAVAIAVALGAGRVDFAGGSPEHRALAEELGATLLEEEFPERVGPYPIAVDFSATHEGLACALRSTAPARSTRSTLSPRPRCRCSRCTRRGSTSPPDACTRGRRWSRCWSWCERAGCGRRRSRPRLRRGTRPPRPSPATAASS